jgi:hypothetical protein
VDQTPSYEASHSVNSPDYGSEGSLPLSQEPYTGLCPEPDYSIHVLRTDFFLISNLMLMFREIIGVYCEKNTKQMYPVSKQSKFLVNIYYYTNECTNN